MRRQRIAEAGSPRRQRRHLFSKAAVADIRRARSAIMAISVAAHMISNTIERMGMKNAAWASVVSNREAVSSVSLITDMTSAPAAAAQNNRNLRR